MARRVCSRSWWSNLVRIVWIGEKPRHSWAEQWSRSARVTPNEEWRGHRLRTQVGHPGNPAGMGLTPGVRGLGHLFQSFLFGRFRRRRIFRPRAELLCQARDLGVDRPFMGLPALDDRPRRGLDDPVVGLDPFVEPKRRGQHRMELVILLLRHRLELVVMAPGALECQSQERRADDLNGSVEHRNLVRTNLVGVAVTLAGAVLTIAEKVGGAELIDDRGGNLHPRLVA